MRETDKWKEDRRLSILKHMPSISLSVDVIENKSASCSIKSQQLNNERLQTIYGYTSRMAYAYAINHNSTYFGICKNFPIVAVRPENHSMWLHV